MLIPRRRIVALGQAPAAPPPDDDFITDWSPTAAWSLKSLLDSEIDVIRVRRTSDSTEQDFTPTEITDGTLATFCSGTDGYIATWYDQSGNGHDATQTTASEQPRIVSSGTVDTNFEGEPGIYFLAGTTAGLGVSTIKGTDYAASLGEDLSFATVVDMDASATYEIISNMGETSAQDLGICFLKFNNTIRLYLDSTTSYTNYDPNDVRVIQLVHDNSANETTCQVNNNTLQTKAHTNTFEPSTDYYFGIGCKDGAAGAGTSPLRGYLSELILWKDRDNYADLSDLYTDISTRWTIT